MSHDGREGGASRFVSAFLVVFTGVAGGAVTCGVALLGFRQGKVGLHNLHGMGDMASDEGEFSC